MRRALVTALLAAAVAGTPLHAAQTPEQKPQQPAPVVTPPPPPSELTKGEEVEPTVTIVRRDWAEIEEYSVNGRVYAVKIKPVVGPAYYLYDADADGNLETRIDAGLDNPPINRWKILTW